MSDTSAALRERLFGILRPFRNCFVKDADAEIIEAIILALEPQEVTAEHIAGEGGSERERERLSLMLDLYGAYRMGMFGVTAPKDAPVWSLVDDDTKGLIGDTADRVLERLRPASPGGGPPPLEGLDGAVHHAAVCILAKVESGVWGDLSGANEGAVVLPTVDWVAAEILGAIRQRRVGGSAERVGERERPELLARIEAAFRDIWPEEVAFVNDASDPTCFQFFDTGYRAALNREPDRASTADPSPAPPEKAAVVSGGPFATTSEATAGVSAPVHDPEGLQDRMRALYDRLVAGGDEEGASVLDDAAWALDALDLDVHLAKHGVPGFPDSETAPSLDPLHLRNAADLADFYRKPIHLPTAAARDLADRLEASAARIVQLEAMVRDFAVAPFGYAAAQKMADSALQGSRPT